MSYIQMLEPELQAAVTVPFAALSAADAPAAAAALRQALEQHGFAIVTDVIDAATIARYESYWADDLRRVIDPAKSTDAAAVAALSADPITKWPMGALPLGTKFVSELGLPHGKMAWSARADPNVRRVFSSIFRTDDLCVGMDNVFFSNEAPEVPEAHRSTSLWPHADQNLYNKPGGDYEVYQGVLYLWPATADTSCTVVWPGSNRGAYCDLMANAKVWTGRGHFCPLQKREHEDFARGARRLPVPAGGLLLWSSRTIHQGWPIGKRLAVPICMEPASRRSEGTKAEKLKCFFNGKPTSHWASLGLAHVLHRGTAFPSAGGVTLRDGAEKVWLTEAGRPADEVVALM